MHPEHMTLTGPEGRVQVRAAARCVDLGPEVHGNGGSGVGRQPVLRLGAHVAHHSPRDSADTIQQPSTVT